MSDNFLCLIPSDPNLVPELDAGREARRLLESFLPDADEVNIRSTETPEFINPLGNLESARCPKCGTNLLEGEWWGDAMDEAHENGCRDLAVHTPCCGAETSLDALTYRMPAGFARFVLEAMNPRVSALSDAQLASLEVTLATPLRVVWVHV